MSDKDKKSRSTEAGKPHKVGRATFRGVLPDDHPIYRSGTRVGFRSGPAPRPAPGTGEAAGGRGDAARKPREEK